MNEYERFVSRSKRGLVDREPCSNCEAFNWDAKNDDYCTGCTEDYMEIFYRVFSREHNPLQDYADKIMSEVQGHA